MERLGLFGVQGLQCLGLSRCAALRRNGTSLGPGQVWRCAPNGASVAACVWFGGRCFCFISIHFPYLHIRNHDVEVKRVRFEDGQHI